MFYLGWYGFLFLDLYYVGSYLTNLNVVHDFFSAFFQERHRNEARESSFVEWESMYVCMYDSRRRSRNHPPYTNHLRIHWQTRFP